MSELPEATPATKPFWQSRTVWINALSLVALIVQTQTGFVISPELQITLLGLVNLILRAVTGSPISWHATNKEGA